MKKINVVLSVSIIFAVITRLMLHVLMSNGDFEMLQSFLPYYSISIIFYLVMLVSYATKHSQKKWLGLLVLSSLVYPFILDMSGLAIRISVTEHMIYYGVFGRVIDLVVAYILLKETKSRFFLVMSVYTAVFLIIDIIGVFVEFDFNVLALALFVVTNLGYVFVLFSRYEFPEQQEFDLLE